MVENYLEILEDSLIKKINILNDIQDYNERQEKLFQSDIAELSVFDEYVEEKDRLIKRLSALDEGFEQLYASVAEELKRHPEKYKTQIKRLQELVAQVMEMGVSVQAKEARNKKLIEEYFAKGRSGIRSGRKTSKAAYDYYKSMNQSNVVPPQFLDQKK